MSFSRIRKVYEVYQVIFVFFRRKVMGFGLMKNKLFRILLGAFLLLFIAGLTIAMYMFWKQSESTISQVKIVLDVYSLTVMMWAFCGFLFIKILFMKTDRFLKFACQFPVTRRETKAAVLMFELMFSFGVIFSVAMAIVISLLLRYGTVFIGRILCNVFFMPITLFLILDLIYVAMEYILEVIGISKMKGVMMFCLNTALLIMLYFTGYDKLLNSMLFGYMDQKGTSPIVFYTYCMEKFGLPVAILEFVFVIVSIVATMLLIPAAIGESENAYLKLRKLSIKKVSTFRGYLLSISRDVDSYNYTVIAYFIFGFMSILKKDIGIYAIVLLSMNSLYSFVHTDSLRIMLMQKRYSVLKDYISLIGSQFLYAIVVTLPMAIVSCVIFGDIQQCLLVYLVLLVSIILFTSVGIMFPPKKDNPFSSCIGIGVVMIFSFAIVAVCGLLELSALVQNLLLITIVCASIGISLSGIKNLKRNERYELKESES